MTAAPRPSSDDPLVALADRCVQCGLCLPACPTYRLERVEAESPRGRIALARAWAQGTVPPTEAGERHLDDCLGCRNCEAACPAGVRFGELLVLARAAQRARRTPRLRQRMVEGLAARPRLLAVLLRLYSSILPALPRRWRLLPPLPRTASTAPPDRCPGTPGAATAAGRSADVRPAPTGAGPAHDAAGAAHASPPGPAPGRASRPGVPPGRHAAADDRGAAGPIAIFVGCAARAYEPPARAALARLARAAGLDVVEPGEQGCCGALHAHAGDTDRAAALARANAAAFAGFATVATLASGCHEALARALPPGRAIDALEMLAARRARLRFRPTPERVALHLPCTQRNVVGSVHALKTLLGAVPDLEVVELAVGHGCCGASGSTMLVDPARARAHRAPLLDALHASGATRLLSANLGCRLHLGGGTPLPVLHPLEFLADRLARNRDTAALD